MKPRLRKPAALIAVAILASGCVPRKIEPGNDPPEAAASVKDGLKGQSERSSDPVVDSARNRVADNDARQTGADVQGPKEDAEIGARPERPWAHNTGPSDPGALRPSGSVTITSDGVVLKNLDISGMVTIDADDVVIRNFRINATATYGIRVVDGHRGILLEDGEIYGMNSAAILGVGFTARRLHIHDSNADGLKVQGTGGPTLVEYSFIEKVGADGEGHCDGNQTRGGSNITFRYNNIYMPYPGTPSYEAPYKSNSTFIIELRTTNFVIDSNWLTGGNYTIYCRQEGGTVHVKNNIFGRENGGLSAGKEALRIRAGSCDEWSGNRWEDTGDPI